MSVFSLTLDWDFVIVATHPKPCYHPVFQVVHINSVILDGVDGAMDEIIILIDISRLFDLRFHAQLSILPQLLHSCFNVAPHSKRDTVSILPRNDPFIVFSDHSGANGRENDSQLLEMGEELQDVMFSDERLLEPESHRERLTKLAGDVMRFFPIVTGFVKEIAGLCFVDCHMFHVLKTRQECKCPWV